MNLFRLKWIRWKYVLPRLAIVLLVAACFRWGLDPLLKWAIISGGESAVGAQVELAAVETWLSGGTLTARDLVIANPNAPLKNLLEAEEAKLHIDMHALARRHFVVQDGLLSNLQFSTLRTTSGLLEEQPEETTDEPALLDPWVDSANQFIAEWLSQFEDRLSKDFTGELKTLQVAQELEQRWPEQYDALQDQVKSLRDQGKQLEQKFRKLRKNPLRHIAELQTIQTQITTAQKELISLQQQISQLPQQAAADRQALLAARQEDQQFLREQLPISELDEARLTQTLLGEPASRGLASALDWLAWARKKVPSGKGELQAQRRRGTNVLFSPAQPRYLVKQLQLEGTAQWGGQTLVLTGVLQNASSQPQLLSEPTRLQLSGTGVAEVEIVATLDRRGEQDQDQIEIACHDVALPGQTFGKVDKLALTIAPSIATLDVELKLQGDALSGQLALRQQSVKINPQQSPPRNGRLAAALEQALSSIEQWEATVQIAGTVQKPKLEIESDLGEQVTKGLQLALKKLMQDRAEELLAETQQKVEARMQHLQKIRQQAEQELMAKLGEGQELFGQLAALSGDTKSGLPIPQLTKSLRAKSLLK